MRRQIPMFIVFVSGMVMISAYFFPEFPLLHGAIPVFLNWGRIALTCGMILGIINLLYNNFKKVALKSPGWIYNLILLLSFAITFYYAIPYHVVQQGSHWISVKGTDPGTVGFKIFMYVYTPLSATMFALIAFYIASAAFRAFRAKNIEAALLIISAVVVMLGSIPFVPHLFFWLSNEIQEYPMTAAMRGILFGVAVGVVSFSVKILTGIDRSYFGGETEEDHGSSSEPS